MPQEPFDAEQVIEVAQPLYDSFSTWQKKNEERHLFRFRLKKVDIAGIAELLEYRSPAIQDHGLKYVNKFDAAKLDIEVSARSDEKAAVRAAQSSENFYYAFHHDTRRRRSAALYGTHRRALDSQVFYGAGIRRLAFAPKAMQMLLGKEVDEIDELLDALSLEGGLMFEGNPFVIECPDLSACAWEPDMSLFCEVGEVTLSQLLACYNDDLELAEMAQMRWRTSDTMEEGETAQRRTVKFWRLETEQFCYEVVGGLDGQDAHLLTRWPNVAGRPWYTVAPGHLTSERNPSEAFLPVIANLYPIVELKNIIGTLINSGALNTGRPLWQEIPVGRTGQDFLAYMREPANERRIISIDPATGSLPEPRPGHQWVPVQVPPQGQLIEAFRQLENEELKVGFPTMLDPNIPTDATSGYDRSRQQEAASTYLEPPLANVAQAEHELFMLASDVLIGLETSVSLYVHPRAEGRGKTLEQIIVHPKDFREQDVSVSYRAIPVTQLYTEWESDLRLYQQGVLSLTTLMSRHYEDPTDELERIKRDQMAQQLDQLAMQDAMAVIGLQRQEDMQQAALDAGLPLPPQPGGPAPGEEQRFERPPAESVVPGLGAPVVPPPQSQNGVPPDMGLAVTGQGP